MCRAVLEGRERSAWRSTRRRARERTRTRPSEQSPSASAAGIAPRGTLPLPAECALSVAAHTSTKEAARTTHGAAHTAILSGMGVSSLVIFLLRWARSPRWEGTNRKPLRIHRGFRTHTADYLRIHCGYSADPLRVIRWTTGGLLADLRRGALCPRCTRAMERGVFSAMAKSVVSPPMVFACGRFGGR